MIGRREGGEKGEEKDWGIRRREGGGREKRKVCGRGGRYRMWYIIQ